MPSKILSCIDSRYFELGLSHNDAGFHLCCLQSDYYALSVVNCDRVQREVQASGEQLLECPQQCSMGVTHVGPECTAAFNIRYIRNQSASYGAEFTMKQYDPLGAAGLCGVDLSVDAKAGAFAAGHMQYLVNMLQKSNTKVTGCDTGKLTSASFVDAKVKCAAAIAGDASSGACNSDCEAAVVAVSLGTDIVEFCRCDHHI
jgi:hypothetical protein